MARLNVVQCDVCGLEMRPDGTGWEQQPHAMTFKIDGPRIQSKKVTADHLCYPCATAFNRAIDNAWESMKRGTNTR